MTSLLQGGGSTTSSRDVVGVAAVVGEVVEGEGHSEHSMLAEPAMMNEDSKKSNRVTENCHIVMSLVDTNAQVAAPGTLGRPHFKEAVPLAAKHSNVPSHGLSSDRRGGSFWETPAVAISLFFTVGPVVITANSKIFKETEFHFPVTLSMFGGLAATILAAGYKRLVLRRSLLAGLSKLPVGQIIIIGLLCCVSIFTGNIALAHMSMSSVQMMKSLTPAVTFALVYVFQPRAKPSQAQLASVAAITFFGLIISYGQLEASRTGLFAMAISILAEALKTVLAYLAMVRSNLSVMDSQLYIGGSVLVFMLAAIWFLEVPDVLDPSVMAVFSEHRLLFTVAILAGCAVNFTSYLIIKATSAVAAKVLVVARNAAFILVCVMFFGESVPPFHIVCYLLTLIASSTYSLPAKE